MPSFLDNPEMVFWEDLETVRKSHGAFFTEDQLNYIAIIETNGIKELQFLPGCDLNNEVRREVELLWSMCNSEEPIF